MSVGVPRALRAAGAARDRAPRARLAFAAIAIAMAAVSPAVARADGPPPPASGDAPSPEVEAAARARFEEGTKAFAAGDYARAAQAFEAANAALPHVDSLYNAARSWEKAGEPARAANLYRAYMRVAPEDAPDKKRVSSALEALSGRLGRIDVVARDVGAIEIDGRPAPDSLVYVVPGDHVVAGTDVGGRAVSRIANVGAGLTVSVVLEKGPDEAPPIGPEPKPPDTSPPPHGLESGPLVTPPVKPPAVPEKPKPAERHGVTPWVAVGFGGLTLVSASVMIASGVDVLQARSDYEDLKKQATVSEQQDLIDEGVYRTDRTNVLIGVTAALGVTTGVVLLFTDFGPRAPKVQAGPLGASVTGTF